jgi:transcriptional regulator with XRE-family HTH domain
MARMSKQRFNQKAFGLAIHNHLHGREGGAKAFALEIGHGREGGAKAFALEIGIAPSTLSRARRGDRHPSTEIFLRICKAIGARPESFLTGSAS